MRSPLVYTRGLPTDWCAEARQTIKESARRLAASAPEMYRALIEAARLLESGQHQEALVVIRSAIEKAGPR